jgi:hypothetical protein
MVYVKTRHIGKVNLTGFHAVEFFFISEHKHILNALRMLMSTFISCYYSARSKFTATQTSGELFDATGSFRETKTSHE